MEKDSFRMADGSKIDINISNVNAHLQIVLNDLRLLELLSLYPFLYCKRVSPFQDEDYDEWAWQQITKAFNVGYSGLELSAPFTSEELQWRWDILRPILGTLAKSNEQQMNKPLWTIIDKINRMMESNETTHQKRPSSLQQYILSQLDLLKQLPVAQQRRLEVEVLNALFHEELQQRAMLKIGERGREIVQEEYEEFLKLIRVRELPETTDLAQHIDSSDTTQCSAEAPPSIAHNSDISMVISNVCSTEDTEIMNSDTELSPNSAETPANDNNEPMQQAQPKVLIKTEPPDVIEPPAKDDLPLRYVPIKSIKYYTKNLKVNLKRIDPDDFMSLSVIRQQNSDLTPN